MTKRKIVFLFPLSLFALCLVFQKSCMAGVSKGLDTALHSALPALFPFLVLSGMITELSHRISGSFVKKLPLVLGLLCGFPIGAICTADLYQKACISRSEANRLLFCCNNTGPSFVIGVCGIGIFGSVRAGIILYLCEAVLVLLFYILSGGFFRNKEYPPPQISTPQGEKRIPELFAFSVKSALDSFLYITAFILFFSFAGELLFTITGLNANSTVGAVISLLLEICSGMRALGNGAGRGAFLLCAGGIGWAGASVHLQTIGILREAQLGCRTYLTGKALLCGAMALCGAILQNLL